MTRRVWLPLAIVSALLVVPFVVSVEAQAGSGWRIRIGTQDVYVGTVARPNVSGTDFGTTTFRWDVFASTLNLSGATNITNNTNLCWAHATSGTVCLSVDASNIYRFDAGTQYPAGYDLVTAASTGLQITAASVAVGMIPLRLVPQASPPGTPTSGMLYMDSTATPDELCVYDGAGWQGISSGTDANCA